MRVVIDCNVLVSAARTRGVCGDVIAEAVRHHQVVLSDLIVDEYRMVAGRLAHAAYREGLFAAIAELERVAVFVDPADIVFGLRDGDDEVYLQNRDRWGRGACHRQPARFRQATLRVGRHILASSQAG